MTPSLKSLRYTTAIAVSLVALSTANQANAQCMGSPIFTCTGSNGAQTISGASTVTDVVIDAGADTGKITIFNTANVNNAGLIDADSATGSLQFSNATGATITNSGTIRSAGSNNVADAITLSQGGTFDIINTGTIENLSLIHI